MHRRICLKSSIKTTYTLIRLIGTILRLRNLATIKSGTINGILHFRVSNKFVLILFLSVLIWFKKI
jgi:hypothetical protein